MPSPLMFLMGVSEVWLPVVVVCVFCVHFSSLDKNPASSSWLLCFFCCHSFRCCAECPSVGITITYLVALCAGVIFFVYLFFKIRSKRAITRAKILISFMQMLNAMPEYEVDWPSNFLNFAKWFSWANLDLFSATSIECLTGSIGTFYTKLLVVCMLPVIAVLALLIMYFVTLHKAKSREQRMQRAGLYMNRVFLVLFIMYPGVSVPLLQVLSFPRHLTFTPFFAMCIDYVGGKATPSFYDSLKKSDPFCLAVLLMPYL